MGDFRTTTGEALPLPKAKLKARLRMGFLIFLLLGVSLLTVGFMVEIDRYVTATGFVTTEEYAEVRPPASGKVAAILVDSGQLVKAGEMIVQLDCSQEEAALEEAKAALRKTEAEAARRRIEIAENKRQLGESIIVLALRLENLAVKLVRNQELFAKGLVPGSKIEDLELEKKLSQAELTSLKNRDTSLFDRELEVLDREVEARRDSVRTAELRVRNREVRAPIAGQVLRYEFVIGELVRPETVLVEIFGGQRKIMKLKVAERFATIVAPGQRYTTILAPYRGANEIIFEGRLEALRNVIQGDGQKTYRVAYCSFEPGSVKVPPGTTGEARIYYGRSNLWLYLLGRQ